MHPSSAKIAVTILFVSLALFDGTAAVVAQEDASNQSGDDQDRPVRRLGDRTPAEEWQPELSVPGGPMSGARLPDPAQDERLQSLLRQLADYPNDRRALADLQLLLRSVLDEADGLVDNNQLESADELIDVVESVDPEFEGVARVRQRMALLSETEGQLAAARRAMAEGRVDQPSNNSAWFFYRKVLDRDPAHPEAIDGLRNVQLAMIARARGYARELDFESAEQLLEEASWVRDETLLIDDARREFEQIRVGEAIELESRAVVAMDAGDFQRAESVIIQLIALGGSDEMVSQLRKRLEEARIYGGFVPGQMIRDHFLNRGFWTPELVVVLAGSFHMGSAADDPGRMENETPRHRVTFRRGFAIGRTEVTVAQFEAFIEATVYKTDADKAGYSTVYDHRSGRLIERDDINWRFDYEGRPAAEDNPVIHVSWNDAMAYAGWLARGTGKAYRLPSEAEFEYVLRGGRNSSYWWGEGTPPDRVENLTGDRDTSRSRRSWNMAFDNYGDGHWGPAPVASYRPSPFGLFDVGGNVAEWVRDCWHDTYVLAPEDGSAWLNPGCESRVIRGGYWAAAPSHVRAAFRLKAPPGRTGARVGFRIARDL